MLRKTCILIVEEDASVSDELQRRLAEEGYNTRTAVDDTAALQLLREPGTGRLREDHGVDLVLLDNLKPDDTGTELLAELRKETSRIELPVIIVTDDSHPREVVRALKAGANDYVTKPIDFDVLMIRVVTHLDLRNSHRSLRESHRALVRAARMESTMKLAAGMAHEVRNPLSQIQLCLDGIRPSLPASETMALEMCDMLGEAVVLANTIVSALIGQADANSLKLRKNCLNEFLRSVLEDLDIQLKTARADLQLNLATDALEAFFAADELRQVIINIVDNAIQAMPEGGALTVRTGVRVPEHLERDEGSRLGARVRNGETAAFIEIEDSGHGIAEGELARVFDPFTTSRATGHASGKGLGLTVARQLIDLHGGHISLENRTDRSGTRVTILLRHRNTALL